MEKKNLMGVSTENLAVPEVHVELETEEEEMECSESVSYDNLAFPEIHIKKKNCETEKE